MFPKEEARTATMCARKGLELALGTISNNAIGTAIAKINARPSAGLVVDGSKFQNSTQVKRNVQV